MRRVLIAVVVLIALVTVGYGVFGRPSKRVPEPAQVAQPRVVVGDKTINLEIANTPEAREQGLSGRESLYGKAILFAFEKPGRYCFWMKDMKFPIDITWIRDNGVVVTIAPEVSPSTFPQKFCPSEPVKYALEFESGTMKTANIIPGSTLQILR